MSVTPPTLWNPRARGALQRVLRDDHVASGTRGWGGALKPAAQALAVYRFGQWALAQRRGPLKSLVTKAYWTLFALVRNVYGIELVATATLGAGVRIEHQHGIVIHPFAVIGDGVQIHHGVTIGLKGEAELSNIEADPPRIGARVVFGVGSVVIGPVAIGDDARIGPNAVVVRDVPAGATVLAPPSRVLRLGHENER